MVNFEREIRDSAFDPEVPPMKVRKKKQIPLINKLIVAFLIDGNCSKTR